MLTCSTCQQSKPRDRFHNDTTQNNGKRSQCKDCRSESKSGEHTVRVLRNGGDAMLAFGTEREQECARAVLKAGTVAKAAAVLKIGIDELRAHLSALRRRAARRGHAPAHDMTHTVPAGYSVKGVSTLYDADGSVRAQWVKSKADEEQRLRAMIDAMTEAAGAWKGKAGRVKAPKRRDEDLLCGYPLGDPHIGMYSWAAETGQSFDLEIAERNLVTAMDHLVALAPPSKEALIANLGDLFHTDNTSNMTSRSHNVLDVDTRWAKVLGVGVKAMRRLIDRALEKHERVTVVNAIGNHDDHSAVFLSIALQQFYEREKRVHIDPSPAKFHWYRFGQNLIGITHTDTVKPQMLPGIMAHDQAVAWGETKHRFWWGGHRHQDIFMEFPGVTFEGFCTLAARDAYSHGAGYRSQQNAKLLVFHREHGQIMRHVVGISQIAASPSTTPRSKSPRESRFRGR